MMTRVHRVAAGPIDEHLEAMLAEAMGLVYELRAEGGDPWVAGFYCRDCQDVEIAVDDLDGLGDDRPCPHCQGQQLRVLTPTTPPRS